MNEDIQVTEGSGNIFADLGLSDADELLTRAKLGYFVRKILEERGLKQLEISHLLGIKQPEVSNLMNGKYHLFSESRLFSFFNKLDQKVTIQVSEHHQGEPWQQVAFLESSQLML
jgi:predicted XRE-type DNA-binding protein